MPSKHKHELILPASGRRDQVLGHHSGPSHCLLLLHMSGARNRSHSPGGGGRSRPRLILAAAHPVPAEAPGAGGERSAAGSPAAARLWLGPPAWPGPDESSPRFPFGSGLLGELGALPSGPPSLCLRAGEEPGPLALPPPCPDPHMSLLRWRAEGQPHR